MTNSKRMRTRGRKDAPGGFAGIPRVVMDHPDYVGLSGNAVKLLMEICKQYKGKNNGDLSLAFTDLKKRGFNSKSTIAKLTRELLESGMIMLTRQGRFTNPGACCALYALSWLPIDECKGKDLEVEPSITPPRKFSLELRKIPGPENGPDSVHKSGRQRQKDALGRFSSVHKRGRLWAVP